MPDSEKANNKSAAPDGDSRWREKLLEIYQQKKSDWWKQQSAPKFPFNYCPHCGHKLSLETFTKEIHLTTK